MLSFDTFFSLAIREFNYIRARTWPGLPFRINIYKRLHYWLLINRCNTYFEFYWLMYRSESINYYRIWCIWAGMLVLHTCLKSRSYSKLCLPFAWKFRRNNGIYSCHCVDSRGFPDCVPWRSFGNL